MLEVFTIGGGEYFVNTFNAVAAWAGGGGYRSMLRVVMVMGLIYSLLVVAFNLDWRAWLNWFLQATAIYMCLMVHQGYGPPQSFAGTGDDRQCSNRTWGDRQLHKPGRRLSDPHRRDGVRHADIA